MCLNPNLRCLQIRQVGLVGELGRAKQTAISGKRLLKLSLPLPSTSRLNAENYRICNTDLKPTVAKTQVRYAAGRFSGGARLWSTGAVAASSSIRKLTLETQSLFGWTSDELHLLLEIIEFPSEKFRLFSPAVDAPISKSFPIVLDEHYSPEIKAFTMRIPWAFEVWILKTLKSVQRPSKVNFERERETNPQAVWPTASPRTERRISDGRSRNGYLRSDRSSWTFNCLVLRAGQKIGSSSAEFRSEFRIARIQS